MHRRVSGVRAGMRADHVRAARVADPVGILSLFSGSGMHDEAVRAGLRLLGYESRVLGFVEREAAAAAWIMGRMEAAALERAPVFCGDLADLGDGDCRGMRGRIGIIVASPPCQPYSSAGKRIGERDERSFGADGRGPLQHAVRIIAAVRPALVWLENVPEWVTGGSFRRFGDELSRVGYAIEEPIFLAAEDVGASQERERVYILCALADGGCAHIFDPPAGGSIRSRGLATGAGDELADGNRRRLETGDHVGNASIVSDGGDELAGPGGAGSQGRRQGATARGREKPLGYAGLESGIVPLFPPGPGGDDGTLARSVRRARRAQHAGIIAGAAADYRRWAELVVGGLDPALMPPDGSRFSTLAYGLAVARTDLLRLGGNGVVPLAAAVAFVEALWRLQCLLKP